MKRQSTAAHGGPERSRTTIIRGLGRWTVGLCVLGLAANAEAKPDPKARVTNSVKRTRMSAPARTLGRKASPWMKRVQQPSPSAQPRAHATKRRRALPDPYPDPCHGLEGLKRRGPRPFDVGEELAYELSVAGAMVGRMELKVGKPRRVEGKTRLPLFGRARTSSFLTTFKSFEGRYMTMVDPGSLAPLGLRVESTYGDDERWERVRFAKDRQSVGADVLLKGRELRREYDGEHDLTDLLTLLYTARVMALSPGLEVCQDVFASRRLWRMTAEVEGVTEIDTPAGDKAAWLVRTKFDRKPTHGLNNRKRPRMEVDIYLAQDAAQTPLQFVVRTQGVTAKGKLVRWSLKGSTSEKSWEL